LLILSIVSSVGLASLAAAGSARTAGDQRAAAFFEQQAEHYLPLRGAKGVYKGLFFLRFNGGTSVDYSWGRNPISGYKPGTGTVLFWLSNGRIVGYLVTISSPGIPHLRIVAVGENVFVSSSKCWNKATDLSAPFGTGDRLLLNDSGAKFLGITKHGSATAVSYSYLWAKGTKAVATDSFSSSKPPVINSRIKLTGKTKLRIRETITPLRKAPILPIKPPPGKPLPDPLC
jgi:hypothetical protein